MSRTLELDDKPLYEETDFADGVHLVHEDLEGAQVYVHIEGGRTVRHSAKRGGEDIEILHLQMSEEGGGSVRQRPILRCYECIDTGSGFRCYRVSCELYWSAPPDPIPG